MMPADLHVEVEKVRAWLSTHRAIDDYDDWWTEGGVVSALQDFLARVAPDDWSADQVTDLLYVLEQSSTGYIVEILTQTAPMALAIARHSLARGGIASDDIAERLGYVTERVDEIESVLLEFMKSDHELTRRLALLSLANLGSEAVPALAVAAWDTGDQYARMGALAALEMIGSALFPRYLLLAREDGSAHLRSFADKFTRKNSLPMRAAPSGE